LTAVDIRPGTLSAQFPAYAEGWTLQGQWHPNESERNASRDVLVELVTRISVVCLPDDEGRVDEALASLYSLFGSIRGTLKVHGPSVANDRRGELSFAVIAAHLLNRTLRPVLSEWHIEVAAGTADENEVRQVLRALRHVLVQYAELFASACGAEEFVRSLVEGERRRSR